MSNEWFKEEFRALRERQEEMNATLVRNTVSLEEHVRRTNLLEQEIKNLEKEIKPVKSHVDFINKAAKLSIVLVGVVEGIRRLGIFG